ncbi:MAG: BsuPI-related putative proteinase inhibitor [Acidobacteriota bacterium]
MSLRLLLAFQMVLFVFAPEWAWAQTDFFPLRVGNQWIYRVSGAVGGTHRVTEVVESTQIDEREYFLVTGLVDEAAWLRMSEEGTLLSLDRETGQEKVWVKFSAQPGETFNTSIHPCNPVARMEERDGRVETPAGTFEQVLGVSYPDASCADAGLEHDGFAPSVGLVERRTTTFAGPQTWSLIYARLGETTAVSRPEISFGLSLDRFRYTTRLVPPTMVARITLRNTHPEPLELAFSSGQRFDLELLDGTGQVIRRWSDGRVFLQLVGLERVGPGEKNWIAEVPLTDRDGNLLNPGGYTARCWLTTADEQPYSASVGFEVSADR